jgi:hypothetical protein
MARRHVREPAAVAVAAWTPPILKTITSHIPVWKYIHRKKFLQYLANQDHVCFHNTWTYASVRRNGVQYLLISC